MKNLRVHGNLLERYVTETGGAPILLQLKEKYVAWSEADTNEALKMAFIEYDDFFRENFKQIRGSLDSERKFTNLIGSRIEEFCYLLFKKKCKQKGLILDRIPRGKIVSWIGFDEESKLLVIGHGADLAIGDWRQLSLSNGISDDIKKKYFVPRIIIECKEYVSLDMFRDLVTESEMFKRIYPYSLFIIVCEVIEMTPDFKRMKKVWETHIDGFFAFRPGKRKEPGELIVENIDEFEKVVISHIDKL